MTRLKKVGILAALLPAFAFLASATVASLSFAVATCNTNQATPGPDYCGDGPGAVNVDLKGGNDSFSLGGGGDTGRGSDDKDDIFGADGADLVVGGAGGDAFNYFNYIWYGVNGGDGGDEARGGGGTDAVNGDGGDDRIYGEEDDDIVYSDEYGAGGTNDSVIDGGGGTDFCFINSGEGGTVANCDGNVYYNSY